MRKSVNLRVQLAARLLFCVLTFPVMPPPPSLPPACAGDCRDAYETHAALSRLLGHRPSLHEALYATAVLEYGGMGPRAREFGQEGLARNLYEACGMNGCAGAELFQFLSGFEPWSDYAGRNAFTPDQRALRLKEALSRLVPGLHEEVAQILDVQTAFSHGWTEGLRWDRPWQWYGPFTPTQRCKNRVHPSLVTVYAAGQVWMLTAQMTAEFKVYCK